ncbi:MAG TPA: 16S rRNA (guanine(966)-N(2))-methyltransferase RsmD [Steroidobacteraceae bacterium]|nr:16S rRNA (guanine(966)-N(2))-methyltransferase RsmD [Steroidobacteraceae bacterium]
MQRARNELRIIGGAWRGRRVKFPDVAAIRPTPDRVRETLFNWLQYDIAGSRCLDLFAGSGALGLEALSRGAARVVFVDREREVIEQLSATLAVLGAGAGTLEHRDAVRFLEGEPRPFDIVFLDPPFNRDLLPGVCGTLESRGWLVPGALIYLESPAQNAAPVLPGTWTLMKSGRAGEVGYHLARRGPTPAAPGETR